MKRASLLLLTLICLVLQPVRAQDPEPDEPGGGDDGPTIEIGGEDDDGGELTEEEKEEIRKKNTGLAGPKEDEDEIEAPKVKASLQVRINEAIKKGVKWLKERQDNEGSWGPVRANRLYDDPKTTGDFTRDETGPTSFAVYTLVKCDVSPKDRTVRKGVAWLKERTLTTYDMTGKKEIQGEPVSVLSTYESASIVLMLEALNTRSKKLTGRHSRRKYYSDNPLKPPATSPFERRGKEGKEDWLWMHNRVLWLTTGRRIGGGGGRARGGGGGSTNIPGTQNQNGGWRYHQANGDQDLSATQFVLLALRAASQAGYPLDKVAPDTFRWAANFCKQAQQGNGAFSYRLGQQWSAGMDACGIGSLLICQEQMQLMGQDVPSWMEDSIKNGMAHLDEVFDVRQNKGWHDGRPNHYYYLYGVERIGDLSGRKEFGGKDWYVRGAEFLLAHQDASGMWSDGTSFPPEDVLGTCFALLFLKRATPPAVTISRDDERE